MANGMKVEFKEAEFDMGSQCAIAVEFYDDDLCEHGRIRMASRIKKPKDEVTIQDKRRALRDLFAWLSETI